MLLQEKIKFMITEKRSHLYKSYIHNIITYDWNLNVSDDEEVVKETEENQEKQEITEDKTKNPDVERAIKKKNK